jgi:glycosyltransferase involved in cell wall biosynthesis
VRVLHLVSVATMTGPADPALSLASAQRRLLGLDARIAFDSVRSGDMARKTKELEVPVHEELALCTKGGLLRALLDRKRLVELFGEYDLIHAHSSHDHGLASLARRRVKAARLVRSIHHPRSAERRAFQNIAFSRTDGFTVVAGAHRRLLLEGYPNIDPDCCVVVPGAVDPDVYSDRKSGAEMRKSFGIPEEAIVIGMIARFQPGRGQPTLIESIAAARASSGLDLWLVFIGKGETQGEIEAAVERFGLRERARLYGFREADLPEAIRSCDLTVLLKEGSDAGCRAVLQSLSCGVPVIGAQFPAIEEALEGIGRVIQPGELASAIVELASLSKERRIELGQLCRRRVLDLYTERHRLKRVMTLYERLMR